MLQIKWVAMALCLMLAFALFLVGCNGNLVPGEDPGSQDPVDNNNNPPDDEPPGEQEPPPLTEGVLEDLESIPFSIIYVDKDYNLVQLDLRDKTRTVLVELVQSYVPDWANNQIALAIADPEDEFFDQGVAEIALYSTIDGSIEVLGTSYMGYGLHFSPNGRFLAVTYGMGGMKIYDLDLGERYDAGDENLLVSVNDLPVWAPSGMAYAMPMIYIWEKAGPPGIYIVDPINGERTLVLEVTDRMARPHYWIDENLLVIEIEQEPYTWVNEAGSIRGLWGKDYVSGEFKILDITTGELTDAKAPDYSWHAPKYESADSTWVLHEVYIDQTPIGRIKLLNTETNVDYLIAEGHWPQWFEGK